MRREGDQPVEPVSPGPRASGKRGRAAGCIHDPSSLHLDVEAHGSNARAPTIPVSVSRLEMTWRQQLRACDAGFRLEPCIKGAPVEMPARAIGTVHEILDHKLRLAPQTEIAVAGAMATVLEVVV